MKSGTRPVKLQKLMSRTSGVLRKAKPLPQAPGQPLVDAGGVDGEEHVSGDGARQDQGHQDDELDYHAMIRDL